LKKYDFFGIKLSCRAVNGLDSLGIKNLKQLLSVSPRQLKSKNVGKGTMREIVKAVYDAGFKMQEDKCPHCKQMINNLAG